MKSSIRLRTFVLGALSLILMIGGTGLASSAVYQRAVELRGQVDPTQNGDLPYRLPLAGLNVELTQYDPQTLDKELTQIEAVGFTWVRQTFLWSVVEPSQGQMDFSRYDPIVQAVAAHKPLRLVAVLDSAPVWARRSEASAADRLYAPPASMAAFGAFAGAFASRYGDRIDYYQVWDEPNLNTHWGGLDPRPADYAAMLKAAYRAIKSSDSTATVITAGLAPTVETGPRNLSDVLFLRALYEAGAGDSFDAVAGKPYGFDSDPYDRTVDESVLNFSRIILLREEMVKHGDGQKALWGSHFGWNHLPPGWSGPPSIWGQVDAGVAGKYTREAYTRAAQEWPWMGGLILEHWQPDVPADDPHQGFAVHDLAAGWFDNGQFFAQNALGLGLHDPNEPGLSYQGDWRLGPLGADVQNKTNDDLPADGSAHQLHFSFEGDSLALKVRRADYVAYVYIRVDGQPANALPRDGRGEAFIILKSPTTDPVTETITAARGLGPGVHSAEVRVYLGYERWFLAGIAVGRAPDTTRFDLLILAGIAALLIGLIGVAILMPRRTVSYNIQVVGVYLRHMADIIGAIAVSGLAFLGMLLTLNNLLPAVLRRDLPAFLTTVVILGIIYISPAFVVTLAALIALWIVIYNRPLIGLALTIFWAPFFLLPADLYYWAVSMVELSLLLTASAMFARRLLVRQPAAAQQANRWQFANLVLADWAMLALVIVAVLSLTWSAQIAPALRELRIIVVEPALFYLMLRTASLTRQDLVRLVDVFILSGATVSGIGLVEYVGGGSTGISIAEQGARRLMSVYTSPNNLALFLGRCIPVGFAMTLVAPGTLRRAVAAIMTLLMLAALLLSQSIGAILLGLPAGLAVVLLLWNWRRGALAIGALIVVLVAALALARFIPRLQGVFDLSRYSSFVRTQLWTSTASLLRERPLTGAGLDQFLYLYRSRYILPDAWAEPDLSHPHNFFLDFWVSLGILGLPILAALQADFWRRGWQVWRRSDRLVKALVIGIMGSMADFLAHGLVDNSYFVVDLAYIFCFCLALVVRLSSLSSENHAGSDQ